MTNEQEARRMAAKGSNNRPTPSSTPVPVDDAQREQALKFIEMLAGRGQEYVPILKSLKAIGIEPKVMTVMIGDEPTDCIVISQQELMSKEWARLSGQETEKS
jgi:hypothetical protein